MRLLMNTQSLPLPPSAAPSRTRAHATPLPRRESSGEVQSAAGAPPGLLVETGEAAVIAAPEPASAPVVGGETIRHRILVQTDGIGHRLKEDVLYRTHFEPLDDSCPEEAFVVVIGIEGRGVWRLDEDERVVGPRQLIAFVADPRVLVCCEEATEARFLVWHFSMEKMRVVREALGQPHVALAATCRRKNQPLAGPFDLNAEQQALVLSLRCAPPTPLRTLWYGAKLLELFAILQPSAVESPAAPGHLHPAVRRTLATLHTNFVNPPVLGEIAAKAGVGTSRFGRIFS